MNKLENDFIQIDKDGTYYYGGNQKWWNSSNETMAKYGCGVIAICNLEFFLDGKLRDMENDDLSDKNNIMKYSDYISIVNKSYKSKYSFGRRVPFDSLGLLPRTMKKGLESLFKKYRATCKVKWAPTLRKNKILSYIRCMLEDNIPIVASYYVFTKRNRLDFYIYDDIKKIMIKKDGCRSHYFNITGIVSVEEEKRNVDYFVISSWGKKYYVSIEDWVAKLSYFTNVLFVKY